MVRSRFGDHNKKLIRGGQFVGIVPLATGHGYGTSMVPVPFLGIGRKKVSSYFSSLLGRFFIIGISPLDNKILHDSMKLGAVKILHSGQINKVCPMVGHIVIELYGKASHVGGEFHLVLFEFFGIVKKEVDGIFLIQYKGFFFFLFGLREFVAFSRDGILL